MILKPADFQFMQSLVKEHSGIILGEDKAYLMETRLMLLADEEAGGSLAHLLDKLRSTPPMPLHRRVAEAMINGETHFFRDAHIFDAIRLNLLPGLIARRERERRLTVWSAGCSTGQEPYSLAMMVEDLRPLLRNWDLRILATDLNSEALARARNGLYSQLEANRGLPAALLARHFKRDGLDWRLCADLRGKVEFRELNLVREWPALPPVDLLLLRNVMIYHDEATKRAILGRVRRALRPDGRLVLGSSETTLMLDDGFEPELVNTATCYRLRNGGTRR